MENKEGETRGFPILLASCLGPSVLQVQRLFLLLVCFFLSFSGRQLCGFLTLSRLDFFSPQQSRRFAPAYRFSLGPCVALGAQRAAEPGYHLGWELGREYSQQKVTWSRQHTGWGDLGVICLCI